VESVFEIIAEWSRRAILSLLVSSQQSVGDIERQLRMSQPVDVWLGQFAVSGPLTRTLSNAISTA
jgi:DNA-binding transcriptional ArsR family regulator